ncbi:MAG TPA: hypothetical protein VG410_09265 [Solirubrobacteraceae bacterium]|nr:hypothetical protein [Solirubrobacteraceae bacterium]
MLPFIIVLVVLAIAMLAITQPLRRARTPEGVADDAGPPATVAELEAAREAKYAEIREAELDHEMGKLSDEDFEAVDRTLRTEAIEILAALDAATIPGR